MAAAEFTVYVRGLTKNFNATSADFPNALLSGLLIKSLRLVVLSFCRYPLGDLFSPSNVFSPLNIMRLKVLHPPAFHPLITALMALPDINVAFGFDNTDNVM